MDSVFDDYADSGSLLSGYFRVDELRGAGARLVGFVLNERKDKQRDNGSRVDDIPVNSNCGADG